MHDTRFALVARAYRITRAVLEAFSRLAPCTPMDGIALAGSVESYIAEQPSDKGCSP
jgi:hypothetical protein